MEERAEYLRQTGRRGKTFVGGYLETECAERLRKAAELRGMNMTQLLEYLAQRVTAELAPEECACGQQAR